MFAGPLSWFNIVHAHDLQIAPAWVNSKSLILQIWRVWCSIILHYLWMQRNAWVYDATPPAPPSISLKIILCYFAASFRSILRDSVSDPVRIAQCVQFKMTFLQLPWIRNFLDQKDFWFKITPDILNLSENSTLEQLMALPSPNSVQQLYN